MEWQDQLFLDDDLFYMENILLSGRLLFEESTNLLQISNSDVESRSSQKSEVTTIDSESRHSMNDKGTLNTNDSITVSKKKCDKTVNHSRIRRQSELLQLREQLKELEKRYNDLTCALNSRSKLSHPDMASNNMWRILAKRQEEAACMAKLDNITLRTKLQQQTSLLQSLQYLFAERIAHMDKPVNGMLRNLRYIHAIRRLTSLSPDYAPMYIRLQLAIDQTDSELSKHGLIHSTTPMDKIDMEFLTKSEILQFTGQACLTVPASTDLVLWTVWKIYNLHTVSDYLPKSTNRSFIQVIADGIVYIQNGTKTVRGNLAAHFDKLGKSKSRAVIEFVGSALTNDGLILNLQSTFWYLMEEDYTHNLDGQSSNEVKTIIRRSSRTLAQSTVNGVRQDVPIKFANDVLFERYKVMHSHTLQQLENVILDTLMGFENINIS